MYSMRSMYGVRHPTCTMQHGNSTYTTRYIHSIGQPTAYVQPMVACTAWALPHTVQHTQHACIAHQMHCTAAKFLAHQMHSIM
jgi:hypothetical protein